MYVAMKDNSGHQVNNCLRKRTLINITQQFIRTAQVFLLRAISRGLRNVDRLASISAAVKKQSDVRSPSKSHASRVRSEAKLPTQLARFSTHRNRVRTTTSHTSIFHTSVSNAAALISFFQLPSSPRDAGRLSSFFRY